MSAAEAPTFVEALGELASAAGSGPRLDVGTVTSVSATKVWVDLAGDGTSAPVGCNRVRSYTPATGHGVLVVMPDAGEPVVLGHLGNADDVAATINAVALRLAGNAIFCDLYDGALRWSSGGTLEAANRSGSELRPMKAQSFRVGGNAIFCDLYDGALRWSSDGAVEIANRDGTGLKGIRTNRLHANDVDSNGQVNAVGLVTGSGFVATGNGLFPPNGIDGAIRWASDGALEVCNRVGTQFRGIRTARLHANDIDSNGAIEAAGGIRANAGLSCGGDFHCGVRARASNWSSDWSDGAIRWDSTGALIVSNYGGTGGRGVFATNFAPYGSSWRSLKTGHQPVAKYLGHSAVEEVRGLDVSAWRYREGKGDGDDRMRIGLHLDELHPKLRVGVSEDAPEEGSYDTVELLNVALAAISEQADQLDAQAKTIADLTSRLEALEAA